MKFALVMMLVLGTTTAFAQNVKDFNKILIEDVKKDIETDNDQAFKPDNSPMRGPASVVETEESETVVEEDPKVKSLLGNSKW